MCLQEASCGGCGSGAWLRGGGEQGVWLLGGRACGRGPWVGVGDDAGWTVMGVHAEGPEKCKGRGRVTPRAAPCGGVGAVGDLPGEGHHHQHCKTLAAHSGPRAGAASQAEGSIGREGRMLSWPYLGWSPGLTISKTLTLKISPPGESALGSPAHTPACPPSTAPDGLEEGIV